MLEVAAKGVGEVAKQRLRRGLPALAGRRALLDGEFPFRAEPHAETGERGHGVGAFVAEGGLLREGRERAAPGVELGAQQELADALAHGDRVGERAKRLGDRAAVALERQREELPQSPRIVGRLLRIPPALEQG